MGQILLVGDNSLTLASYTAVLASLDREVLVCNTSDCMGSLLMRNRIDLIIICFSVSDHFRRSIISDASAQWPRPQILQMVASEESPHCMYGADAYVSAVDPRAVVTRARALLAARHIPHAPALQRYSSSPCGSEAVIRRS